MLTAQKPLRAPTSHGAVNDKALDHLASVAKQHDMTLVHISTAYVFDGTKEIYTEDDTPNPLGGYAKSKTAGDKRVVETQKHYIIRTDSVIGGWQEFRSYYAGTRRKRRQPDRSC